MTKLLAFFSTLFLVSCSKDITGVYRHRICDVGPNCFYLSLNKNHSFKYKFVIVNDSIRFQLDKGAIQCDNFLVKTVKLEIMSLEPLRDSIFTLNTSDNNISIYTVVPPAFDSWISRKYLVKGNKLYPLSY
jgi:hypothetical protein